MFTKRIFWQLFLLILLIVAGSLVSLGWFFGLAARQVFLEVAANRGSGLVFPQDSASIDFMLETFYRRLAFGGLAVASLAAIASFAIARRVSRPLEELDRGAQKLARGHLQTKLLVADFTEIGSLAETINQMSLKLDERLRDALQQSREQEAIFSSMLEGVVVMDLQGRIVRVNAAALDILGCSEDVIGQEIGEAIHQESLVRMIRTVLEGEKSLKGDLVLQGESEIRIQACCESLKDSFGRSAGVYIVINDRTNIQRLENLRRDFAAHVSHELQTPLTAIKGFADTLLRGALRNPADSERFVRVIADQAERMERLVEKLLELARLEKGIEDEDIERTWEDLFPVLDAAAGALRSQAQEKRVELSVECSEGLMVLASSILLERAVVNLVDNAIRHGVAGTSVKVSAKKDDKDVVVTVEDDGLGIAPSDCDHIFERFYRTKTARGSDLGGSGLGLSFVKHVALAHKGTIEVSSDVGVGSTFRLRIPSY